LAATPGITNNLIKLVEKVTKMDLEKLLVEVAKCAGDTLKTHAFDMGDITMKHDDDPVTSLDKAVEKSIRKNVLEHMPANFIGEEYGREDNGADCTWIIDPIDGTKSMIAGEFNTSLSIGIEKGGKLVAGCIYDFMRDIMYLGYEDKLHVYHNGGEVAHQKMPVCQKRIIIDGEGIRNTEIVRALQHLEDIKIIEKNGSIALAMAQVASGVYDGMVYKTNNNWNSWDIAGGLYLLNCTGQALNLELESISLDVPQQGIIGINHNMLPAILLAKDTKESEKPGYL
jgi:myo-inositol-1(or 4)-monophosphatase